MAILPMAVPIVVYQGEAFVPPAISWVDSTGTAINLTGYTATMTVRQTVNSNAVSLLATTGNGLITINGTLGQIQITIPASNMSGLAPFEGVYDLFLFSPTGTPTRLLGGTFSVPESVYQ